MEFSITRRVGTKRNDNFSFSLFPIIFQPILTWNEVIMVFFNFFAIFLEFSITRRVRTELNNYYASGKNRIFYYASSGNRTEQWFLFSLFPGLFRPTLAWNKAITLFFSFLNFFPIFLEFSITCRVGMEWNGTIISIFSPSRPFPTYFGLKRSHNGIFEFFCYFFGIFGYASGCNGTEW